MSVYSIYRTTYIQLNEYWIKMYGLDINNKYYISVDNWLELMQQETITIKDMNNIIKDLHLEKEVSLMNEEKKKCKDDDEDVDEDREDHEDPEDHNNDEHSILASFLKNMRMYKGDEQVARSAMVDVHGSEIGAPVVAPTAKRQKSTTSCSASSSSNKK